MIAYFVLGLALLAGTWFLMRWFVSAQPGQVARFARWTLAGLGAAFGLYLLFAGRQALAVLALPALIPLALRWRAIWRRLKAAGGPAPGQTSEVQTRFLRMALDHDSGDMDGQVKEGRFAGCRLSAMSIEDLLALWQECGAVDAQSASILESFMDRQHGEAWRAAAGAGASGSSTADGPLSREEALEILGLEEGANDAAIRVAHRRLMQKIHPDHGGSNYLAAKINQAKELLLKE